MHIEDGLLTPFWLLCGWLLAIPALILAAKKSPWKALGQDHRASIYAMLLCVVAGLWAVNGGGIYKGLNVHLLGATLLALTYGADLAMLSLALLTLCWTALGLGGWQSLGANLVILAVVPTLIVRTILYFTETRLPGNIFIYIFVVVFMGSGLTIAAVSGLATLFLMGSGAYTYPFLFENWLVSMILNAWGEAFVTGMLLTIMVVYYPHLVTTFDDEHYLRNRKP